MALYNWFGTNALDIQAAYSQSDLTDFDVASVRTSGGGMIAIENAMDLVEGEILNHLSGNTIQLFETIEYMMLPKTQGTYTLRFPYLWDMKIHRLPKAKKYCDPLFASWCSDQIRCINGKADICDIYLFTDWSILNDTITFGPSYTPDDYDYFVSYSVDTARTNLPTMKKIIRDGTAYALGQQLYTRQDDSWKLVDYYGDSYNKAMEMLDDYFVPAEYLTFKWLNPIKRYKNGITSVRIGR